MPTYQNEHDVNYPVHDEQRVELRVQETNLDRRHNRGKNKTDGYKRVETLEPGCLVDVATAKRTRSQTSPDTSKFGHHSRKRSRLPTVGQPDGAMKGHRRLCHVHAHASNALDQQGVMPLIIGSLDAPSGI